MKLSLESRCRSVRYTVLAVFNSPTDRNAGDAGKKCDIKSPRACASRTSSQLEQATKRSTLSGLVATHAWRTGGAGLLQHGRERLKNSCSSSTFPQSTVLFSSRLPTRIKGGPTIQSTSPLLGFLRRKKELWRCSMEFPPSHCNLSHFELHTERGEARGSVEEGG